MLDHHFPRTTPAPAHTEKMCRTGTFSFEAALFKGRQETIVLKRRLQMEEKEVKKREKREGKLK